MKRMRLIYLLVLGAALASWAPINAQAQTLPQCEPAGIPNTYVPECATEALAYTRATEDARKYFAANPRDAYGHKNKLCPTIKTRYNGPYVWAASVPTESFACTEEGSGYVNPVFRAQFKPDDTTPPDAGLIPFDPGKSNECDVTTGPNMVGNPINLVTGYKTQMASDFIDPAGHLDFSRSYTSAQTAYNPSGTLGFGWRHTFQSAISMYSGRERRLLRPSGNSYAFREISGLLSFDADVKERIIALTTDGQPDGWRVTATDGRAEYFNRLGRLERIEFQDGDVLTLSYNRDHQLQQVVDRRGRSLSFIYAAGHLTQVTLPDGAAVRYTYQGLVLTTAEYRSSRDETAGTIVYLYEDSRRQELLTGIVDESGNRYATWTYDEYGRAISSRHGGVDSPIDLVTLAYQSGSTVVTGPLGGAAVHGHLFQALRGKVISIDRPCITCGGQSAQSIRYDQNGYPRLRTGFRGSQASVRYNARGLIVHEVEAANDTEGSLRTIETDWHSLFQEPVERRTFNAASVLVAKTLWTYNVRGQATSTTQVDPSTGELRTASTRYCEAVDMAAGTCPLLGLPIESKAAGMQVGSVYTYYPADAAGCATVGAPCAYRKGDLWRMIDPLGQVLEYLGYDSAGRVTSQKDANGIVTLFEYHPRGWLTATRVLGATAAEDRVTRIDYWSTGQISRVVQPDGTYTSYRYDSAQRLVEVKDNAGNTVEYVLDNAGNRIAENTRDSAGALTRSLSRIYSRLGELTTSADASANPTDFEYDSSGNNISVTDALGHLKRQTYDPLNRLTRIVQDVGGIGAESSFKYDALDKLIEATDPKGLRTTYEYNGFGDHISLVSPDTGTTTFTVDVAGNRRTRTDARGITTTYQYDALSRLTSVTYPDPTEDVGYIFDVAPAVCAAGERFAAGRLGTVRHAGGSTAYCYDRFGQLTRKVQTVNDVVRTVRYAYTKGGQLAQLTYPDGSVADYVRDSLGRISGIDLMRPGQPRQVVISQVRYAPFGPATSWTYGNGRTLQRPVDQDYRTIAVLDAAIGGVSLGFRYNEVGNITELKNGSGDAILAQYSYDALGRLSQTKDGETGVPIETYSYDATGNRTALQTSAGITLYSYPADSHRLTAVDGDERNYDSVGNTISFGSRELVYGNANRMSFVKQGGVITEGYVYNHRGERVERAPMAREAQYTLYGESSQWLGNYSSTGQVQLQGVWLEGYPVAVMSGPGEGDSVLAYVEPDHLGTPRVVVDPIRNVIIWEWSNVGEAFGNQSPNTDPDGDGIAFDFATRFPGQQATEASGLVYNTHRDFDTGTGRYAQSDPIGLSGGPSTYGYVSGNPLSNIDPLGLADKQLGDHKTGRWIDCGKGCRIRIDFNLDIKTGQLVRHLHWECRDGREGECGENGEKSHGGSWDDAPRHIRDCALKNGFAGEPSLQASPSWPRFEALEQTPGAKAATASGAIIVIGAFFLWLVGG